MNPLILFGLALLAMLAWSLFWLVVYASLYARHDTSGDGGLGFFAVAVLPWVAPFFLFTFLRRKWRRFRRPIPPAPLV